MVKIVQSAQFVTLIGAGSVDEADLRMALAIAPILIAADGGADRALDLGVTPRAVVGDLDSVDHARAAAAGVPVHRIEDQNTTDLEKALGVIDAPGVIALGVLGPRTDHALASMSTLARYRQMNIIAVGEEDAVIHLAGDIALDCPVGTRVSLFPLAPVRVRATGLAWPLENLLLDPLARIGTSNAASADRVSITVDRPGLLMTVPKALVGQLVAAVFPR